MAKELIAAVGCEVRVLNPSHLALIYGTIKKTDKEDFFTAFPAGLGVKVSITGPAGISRGTSIVSRWFAGMSTGAERG